MRYEITHTTTYTYEESVSIGHHLARMAPRELPLQSCEFHELDILPVPTSMAGYRDYFGNATLFFGLHGAHKTLKVTARSFVEVKAPTAPKPLDTPAWEKVRVASHANELTPDAEAGEFCFASPFIRPSTLFADYAAVSFKTERPILDAALELNTRLFRDFKFDPKATDVATPVEEAFKQRSGVCQDFAHILIACLRSIGLPARYVSGYLETLPPPGKPRLIGADASHAWVSIWCGEGHGWFDLDPTNNCMPTERHITVAYGRDFSDVSPLRGVVSDSGDQQMSVAVDVMPKKPSSTAPVVPTQGQSQSQSQSQSQGN